MNTLIALGDAIKATPTGLVSGYLVRFGDESSTDLSGDFFTKDTDFGRPFVKGVPQPLNLYYAHGFDPVIGKKAVGTGSIKMDEVGLWFEAQINQSDAYRAKLAQMATMKSQVDGAPVLGYSSGAAAHLVERVPIKDATGNVKANRIESWPLGEGSLTPRPCESQNTVEGKALKSILLTEDEFKATLTESRKSLKGYLYTDDNEAASAMAMAILMRAHDRLYSTFYDVVRYSTSPREQRLAALEEALDEFEDICLRYAGAVLMGTAQETPEEAGEGIEAMKTALKALPAVKGTTAPTTTPDALKAALARETARAQALTLDRFALEASLYVAGETGTTAP